MKKIIIFGSSGHAKVIINIVEQEKKYQIAGIVDNHLAKGATLLNYNLLGKDSDVAEIIAEHSIYGAIVAIGDNYQRYKVTIKIKEIYPELVFVTTIHPDAIIANEVSISEGSIVMAGVIIGPSNSIGEGCIINTGATLDHDSSMGNYSSLAPNTTTGGNVSLGMFSAVGISATINNGINIGEHTVIGASSTVLQDIPSHQVCYGTPAKLIRSRKTGERYL